MRVRRGRKAERPLKRDLARGGVEEVRAAHDLFTPCAASSATTASSRAG